MDDYNDRELTLSERLNELYSDDVLIHYGKAHDDNPPGRGSGRYEFGSGERIYQHNNEAYARYAKLRKSGMSDTLIAKALGYYKTDRFGNVILDENGEPQGNTALLRANVQILKNDIRNYRVEKAIELKDTIDPDTGKPYTNAKIGEMLGGIGESTVRELIKNEEAKGNANLSNEAADKLKELVGEHNYIDIGRGTELELGISHDRLKTVQEMLKKEGYEIYELKTPQVGMNGEMTTTLVLCPQGASFQDMIENRYNIVPIMDPNGDSTMTLLGMRDPVRVSRDRIDIRFDEDGGSKKDGVIELRGVVGPDGKTYPACEDLDMGNAKYAQVRIAVEGDKYIKGMAIYNPDLPENVDIRVNSNKSVKDVTADKDMYEVALKKMKMVKDKDGNEIGVDPDNPFGATVYQSEYGPDHKLSAINIVGDSSGKSINAEGSWGEWSKNLSSQFLGKQSEQLIQQQLKLKVQEKQQELDEIMALNNPVVKRQMLLDFADGCDAAATDLKAAPLPNQRVHVILPVDSMKDTEVYAPNYPSGTTVALVRFPHAGPFETPVLKVNNYNKEASGFMKDAKDAVGINAKTASILSGADFDGDTVVVIPLTRKNSQGEFEKTVNIKGINNGQEKLPGLDGFNPKAEYPGVDSQGKKLSDCKRLMTKRDKGIEMGKVSNLITDMSIKGCEPEELARAVKYSMVVIDAEKHKLNYLKAEKDYNIQELKDIYQSNPDGKHGVSTILSRAGSPVPVPKRAIGYDIDPDTGKKIFKEKSNNEYEEERKVRVKGSNGKYLKDENGKYVYETDPKTGKPVYEKTGKTKIRTQDVSRMSTVDDARELMSTHPSNKEILYADYANKMKALANESRKASLSIPKQKVDPEAKKKYAAEVDSLNAKLNDALKNAPLERFAQRLANQNIQSRKADTPDMDNDELKRLKGQALKGARARVGANKHKINFTEKEWQAVNAHAISESKLTLMLKNANPDNYKALATPRKSRISFSTANRIQGLLNAGWTREEIEKAGYASMETIRKVQAGDYEKN